MQSPSMYRPTPYISTLAAISIALLLVACSRGKPAAPAEVAETNVREDSASAKRTTRGETTSAPTSSAQIPGDEKMNDWPNTFEDRLGEQVELVGTAQNAKMGAVLVQDEGRSIFIDGLEDWPDPLQGKKLRVRGEIIKRDDNPVFLQKKGEPIRAGIPAASEEEAARLKWRYLLKDASWEAI